MAKVRDSQGSRNKAGPQGTLPGMNGRGRGRFLLELCSLWQENNSFIFLFPTVSNSERGWHVSFITCGGKHLVPTHACRLIFAPCRLYVLESQTPLCNCLMKLSDPFCQQKLYSQKMNATPTPPVYQGESIWLTLRMWASRSSTQAPGLLLTLLTQPSLQTLPFTFYLPRMVARRQR